MNRKKKLLSVVLASMIAVSLYAGIIYNGQEYTETNMPVSYSGSVQTFIVVSGTITSFNSSRMNVFEINGVNMLSSSTLPSPIDGKKYFIRLQGKNKNSTASIQGSNDWTVPSMTVNPTTLSGFVAEPDTPSSEQTFTVSGQFLTADISVSAPINYELSTTSGSGYGATNITLTQIGGAVSPTTIYVRLKAGLSVGSYNGETITISSTGINDETISLSGSVQIPDPSMSVTPTSLTGFLAEPDTPSSEQSFTISGQDLIANIILNAPMNYEISTSSGSGFGSNISLTQSGGTIASTTIYVRLRSGLSAGSYNGEMITISTTGASDQTVNLSGDVIETPSPYINVSLTSLSGFDYIIGNGPSFVNSFTVSGLFLTDDITLNVTSDYEISTSSGSGFGSNLSLTHSNGTVVTTTIYVRLKAGLSVGSYNGESISISSNGANEENITLSGEVLAIPDPIITVSPTFLSGFLTDADSPSPEQSFTVSGEYLTGDIILSAPTDYEISTTSGDGFVSSITLISSAGTVESTTIYVRLKSGLFAGTYNEEIIEINTPGANSETVTCNGMVQNTAVVNWNGNDYAFVEMPYSYSGSSVMRIYTYGEITSFSTNNKINSLEINGQSFPINQTITTPPASIDQKYFITITPKNSQGFFNIIGVTRVINYVLNIKLFLQGAFSN